MRSEGILPIARNDRSPIVPIFRMIPPAIACYTSNMHEIQQAAESAAREIEDLRCAHTAIRDCLGAFPTEDTAEAATRVVRECDECRHQLRDVRHTILRRVREILGARVSEGVSEAAERVVRERDHAQARPSERTQDAVERVIRDALGPERLVGQTPAAAVRARAAVLRYRGEIKRFAAPPEPEPEPEYSAGDRVRVLSVPGRSDIPCPFVSEIVSEHPFLSNAFYVRALPEHEPPNGQWSVGTEDLAPVPWPQVGDFVILGRHPDPRKGCGWSPLMDEHVGEVARVVGLGRRRGVPHVLVDGNNWAWHVDNLQRPRIVRGRELEQLPRGTRVIVAEQPSDMELPDCAVGHSGEVRQWCVRRPPGMWITTDKALSDGTTITLASGVILAP